MATELAVKPAHTFLYGEIVYLRPLEKADAKRAVTVRQTPFPESPERVEAWITEDYAKSESSRSFTYAIVRTADDVAVGSIKFEKEGYLRFYLTVRIVPLCGESGNLWKAEAIELASEWLLNEVQIPTVILKLPASDASLVDRLVGSGFVITTRLREKKIVDGVRVDELTLQRFNDAWLVTMGDPMAIELQRTGSGIARPVPAKLPATISLPKNATLIGQRVYLRPYRAKDLEESVLWTRRETETFHIGGRQLPSLGEFVKDVDGDEQQDLPEFVFFSVCLIETDEMIGEVGLIHLDYINRNAETASWFQKPDFREHGYGSEAKHLLLEYAFDTLNFHMLESCVRFENTRSSAALRKQGYRESGRIAWMSFRDGAFSNFVTFDLLAEEWRALSST